MLAGIVAVALNLRATITVVGPLVPTIRDALGVGNVAIGAIGTLPVLAFGLFAPLAPVLARRVGIGRSLAGSMLLLAIGTVLRSLGSYAWLVTGTVVLGVAIAIGNVLVPALIKNAFPERIGTLTSLYGAVMVVGASLSAGVAVPFAQASSWQLSLGVWALPAALAVLVVAWSVWRDGRRVPVEERTAAAAVRRAGTGVPARVMHRSAVAWWVTAFMGLQSVLFYAVLAWLPDVLVERGMDDATAGAMLSVLNTGGLVGILLFPIVAGRRSDQRWYGVLSGGLTLLSVLLLLPDGTRLAPVASVLFGLGSGGTVGLALASMSWRTRDPRDATALSGMAQTWGYVISAFGPIGFGALRDVSASWQGPLVLLAAVAAATTVAGWGAGRDVMLVTDAPSEVTERTGVGPTKR